MSESGSSGMPSIRLDQTRIRLDQMGLRLDQTTRGTRDGPGGTFLVQAADITKTIDSIGYVQVVYVV